MSYEWDDNKNCSNIEKHCLSFEFAAEVFTDIHFTQLDKRFNYGEDRYLTMVLLRERVVIVSHTPRNTTMRIISMRKANDREKSIFNLKLNALKEAGFYE